MALIECTECGKNFSDKAPACPGCGCPTNSGTNKKNTNIQYGKEIGVGIKESMQGLNTMASPKSRKMCIGLIVIPFVGFLVFLSIGIITNQDAIAHIGTAFGLALGAYQFYAGNFKKGLIYTITFGGLLIGALADLFKLCATKTFKDANGFPLIY